MHECICTTIIRCYEAVSFGFAKVFYFSICHRILEGQSRSTKIKKMNDGRWCSPYVSMSLNAVNGKGAET